MSKERVNYKKMYYGFPIFFVSFYDEQGVPNITTISSSFSLMDMVCLGFGSKGYAINEIKKVKDFVINIPNRSFMKEIDFCGFNSGRDCNKFDAMNLTPIKSEVVNAPIIEECTIAIECTLTDIIEREYYRGITNILAKVKGRIVSSEALDEEGKLNYVEVDPVLYVGDSAKRVYRYTEKETIDEAKSFL
ncbi:flavin reductase family protein [Clostridium bovifaecis]|uniref:Flavin reductase family protein n=1 Tax=Clostridium bovifaecis TaxID=2184719 RepID=A0A6I6ETN4_9CLOT|nr:flavin reductase family protein [Clostridium bovifaecis]